MYFPAISTCLRWMTASAPGTKTNGKNLCRGPQPELSVWANPPPLIYTFIDECSQELFVDISGQHFEFGRGLACGCADHRVSLGSPYCAVGKGWRCGTKLQSSCWRHRRCARKEAFPGQRDPRRRYPESFAPSIHHFPPEPSLTESPRRRTAPEVSRLQRYAVIPIR